MLEEVKWKENDPLAGIVEGISPFHMIDWWGGFVISKLRVPKLRVPKLRVPKLRVPKESRPKKCIVPRRITANMAAKHARKVMNNSTRPSNFKGDAWYLCVLRRMEQPSVDMWYMDLNGITAVITHEMNILSNYQKAIENDATVKVTRYGTYMLSLKQRKKLDRIDKDWARKILYPEEWRMTKHQRDLKCIEFARALTNHEMKKYWLRFHKNARNEIIKMLKEAWCDDALILIKLRNFRHQIHDTYRKFLRRISPYGRQPSYAEKLIMDRWRKSLKDKNSFLNCYTSKEN